MNRYKRNLILFTVLMALLFCPANSYSRGAYICYDKVVNIGQSMDSVKSILGEPVEIEASDPVDENDQADQNNQSDESEPSVVISKWIYKCDLRTYRFVFQNENLINILLINATTTETPEQ